MSIVVVESVQEYLHHLKEKLWDMQKMKYTKALESGDETFFTLIKSHSDEMSCLQYTVDGAMMKRFLVVDGNTPGNCPDQGYPVGQGILDESTWTLGKVIV